MRLFSRPLCSVFVIVGCAWALLPAPASAAFQASSDAPSLQCRRAIRAAERSSAIPDHLLAAIAHVETGRRDPGTGEVGPWPWTIDAEGQGYMFDTKADAISAVRALQARGVRSIDVGCLQVNLAHHPDAFGSLDQAFDPQANALYAARFLSELFGRSGEWPKAAAMYHSSTPDLGAEYEARVLAAWPAEKLAQAAAMGGRAFALADAGPAAPPAQTPVGRVAVFLPPNRSEAVRIIPLGGSGVPGEAAVASGRTLDSYRAAPVLLAARPVRAGG